MLRIVISQRLGKTDKSSILLTVQEATARLASERSKTPGSCVFKPPILLPLLKHHLSLPLRPDRHRSQTTVCHPREPMPTCRLQEPSRPRWIPVRKEIIWSLCELLHCNYKYSQLTSFDSALYHRVIRLRLGPREASLGSIHVPYELLMSAADNDLDLSPTSDCLDEDEINPEIWLEGPFCLEVLGLLVQWLHTGKYNELCGPVSRLSCTGDAPDLDLSIRPDLDQKDTMDWAVKAATLAWLLGDELWVLGFRSYAMERLFAALARKSEQPQLTPDLCEFAWGHTSESGCLDWVLMDLVVRNWGDGAVVDQADLAHWFSVMCNEVPFQDKFMIGSLIPLEKRLEEVLVLKDYL